MSPCVKLLKPSSVRTMTDAPVCLHDRAVLHFGHGDRRDRRPRRDRRGALHARLQLGAGQLLPVDGEAEVIGNRQFPRAFRQFDDQLVALDREDLERLGLRDARGLPRLRAATAITHTTATTSIIRLIARDIDSLHFCANVAADHLREPGTRTPCAASAEESGHASRWAPTRFAAGDTHGANDEPLGGGADVIEGITGDQGHRPCGRRVQHRDVLRIDHPRPLDAIDVAPLERVELDRVARDDVLQAAEEAVAVPGDARVSFGSRTPCLRCDRRRDRACDRRCRAAPATSSRIFGIRSTASGAGAGTLSALRQALTRSGDQRDWSGKPAVRALLRLAENCCSARRVRCQRRSGTHPRRQAGQAKCPDVPSPSWSSRLRSIFINGEPCQARLPFAVDGAPRLCR